MFGLAQVIKKIKRHRVVRVGTKLIVGSEWRLADALEESEDSTKLNTVFIERLNLTIRQGCAYLRRRSPCHARKKRALDDHLELFRCFYNFARPHSGSSAPQEGSKPSTRDRARPAGRVGRCRGDTSPSCEPGSSDEQLAKAFYNATVGESDPAACVAWRTASRLCSSGMTRPCPLAVVFDPYVLHSVITQTRPVMIT
ncbi:MAG: transposase [bacterium]|nr:transposase [bacterium]